MDVNSRDIEDDLVIIDFEQYSYSTFTFIEVFDTSVDGQSGGFVRLGSGIGNGIGTRRIILVITPVRPGANVSLFLVGYSEDLVNGGQTFMHGRMTPDLSPLYM